MSSRPVFKTSSRRLEDQQMFARVKPDEVHYAPHRELVRDVLNVTKNALFFLLRAPTHHSFTFNFQFLYELKRMFHLPKLCVGFSIFDSVLFLLNFIFLFNKKHGLFDFKTS